jgi:hypothetical protein
MAIQGRFPVEHGAVFPKGAFLKGSVEPVIDFEKSKNGAKVQAVDVNRAGEGTGLPVWQVTVLDADDEAGKRETALVVKFLADVRPVPPENKTPFPFTPVEFVGLSALPYVDDSGQRPRLAWSFRAEGMTEPGRGSKASGSDAKAGA